MTVFKKGDKVRLMSGEVFNDKGHVEGVVEYNNDCDITLSVRFGNFTTLVNPDQIELISVWEYVPDDVTTLVVYSSGDTNWYKLVDGELMFNQFHQPNSWKKSAYATGQIGDEQYFDACKVYTRPTQGILEKSPAFIRG